MSTADMPVAEVVTLGECLISLIATERGPLAESGTFSRTVAGAEANVAVGLARLGHRVAYIGRVGADAFGTVIVRRLRGEGVDVRHLVTDASGPTGLMVRELRDLGPMEIIYQRAGSAGSHLSPEDIDAARPAIEGARWLHLTGITPALSPGAAAAVVRAKELARAAGVTVSLDLNIRRRLWSEADAAVALRGLVEGTDLVLGGLDEAALVGGIAPTLEEAGRRDPMAAAEALLGLGTREVVVKLGPDGALRRISGGASLASPAVAVPRVVDPVGAGDAFTAGYVALTLEGASPELALRAANASGALAVSTVGDLTGLPDRSTLDALLSGPGRPDTLRRAPGSSPGRQGLKRMDWSPV